MGNLKKTNPTAPKSLTDSHDWLSVKIISLVIIISVFSCLLFSCGSKKTKSSVSHDSIKIENKDLKQLEFNQDIENIVLSIIKNYQVKFEEKNDSIIVAPDGTEKKYGNAKNIDLTGDIKTDIESNSLQENSKVIDDNGEVIEQSKTNESIEVKKESFFKTFSIIVFFGVIVGLLLVVLFYMFKKK